MSHEDILLKVSIIMPTFNRAALIGETIESIRRQTYCNWELIIVDDGSDDNTAEIVSNIKDDRVQFYKEPKTGIGGRIKNMGLKKAVGELYAFIDSDDIWAPEKLEQQVKALQQYPGAGFCLTGGFNFIIPYEPVEFFYKERTGIVVKNVFTDYFRSQLPAFTQALLLRKECLAVTGFFKEEKSFSDLDFILTLAWNYTAVIVYEPLFYRRLHTSSFINNNTWIKSYDEAIAIINDYTTKKMVQPQLARQSLFKLYLNFAEDCLSHKQYRKAMRCCFYAWKNKPLSIVPLKKTIKAFIFYFKK